MSEPRTIGEFLDALIVELTTLRAENVMLREALAPLVPIADFHDSTLSRDDTVIISFMATDHKNIVTFTVGDCRNARAALQAGENDADAI
jgi:hypothetical protein